jgi:2-polyprenyl-6-methoxyphenol hydroxylase-like FAD-dependent oxidoreductase
MKVVICGAGIASDVAYPIDEVSVGADGVHSTVRRLVFGDESKFLRYLGFHTAAFVFDAPGRRAATEGRFVLTDTVGRKMGFFALRDGRIAAFAVHRTPDPALPNDIRDAVRSRSLRSTCRAGARDGSRW